MRNTPKAFSCIGVNFVFPFKLTLKPQITDPTLGHPTFQLGTPSAGVYYKSGEEMSTPLQISQCHSDHVLYRDKHFCQMSPKN